MLQFVARDETRTEKHIIHFNIIDCITYVSYHILGLITADISCNLCLVLNSNY